MSMSVLESNSVTKSNSVQESISVLEQIQSTNPIYFASLLLMQMACILSHTQKMQQSQQVARMAIVTLLHRYDLH